MVTGTPLYGIPLEYAQRFWLLNLSCRPGAGVAEAEAEAEADEACEEEGATEEEAGGVLPSTYQTRASDEYRCGQETYLGLCCRWCTDRSEVHYLPDPDTGYRR